MLELNVETDDGDLSTQAVADSILRDFVRPEPVTRWAARTAGSIGSYRIVGGQYVSEDAHPRVWQRLPTNPPSGVRRVRTSDDSIFERMDETGYYWSAPGWEAGVSWTQLLHWGPVTEVIDE